MFRPANTAGIHLLLRSHLNIPARTEVVHGDMNCEVNRPMTFFAFRTHAHQYGRYKHFFVKFRSQSFLCFNQLSNFRVITGYTVKDGDFAEIARGDPQKPQTFYPMEKFVHVKKGDYLAARCTFDSTSSDHDVKIGKF